MTTRVVHVGQHRAERRWRETWADWAALPWWLATVASGEAVEWWRWLVRRVGRP